MFQSCERQSHDESQRVIERGNRMSFRALSPRAFLGELSSFEWHRRVWRIDMHHTFHPDHARWEQIGSRACIQGMRCHHVEERGFSDIAQHVSIMPDGEIWTGRSWNETPASVGYGMNKGVFMFEAVGNFDVGCDRLEGPQLASVLTVIAGVQRRFRLPAEALLFHREVPQTDKTCPGSSISKASILAGVRQLKLPRMSSVENLERLPLEHNLAAAA